MVLNTVVVVAIPGRLLESDNIWAVIAMLVSCMAVMETWNLADNTCSDQHVLSFARMVVGGVHDSTCLVCMASDDKLIFSGLNIG